MISIFPLTPVKTGIHLLMSTKRAMHEMVSRFRGNERIYYV